MIKYYKSRDVNSDWQNTFNGPGGGLDLLNTWFNSYKIFITFQIKTNVHSTENSWMYLF